MTLPAPDQTTYAHSEKLKALLRKQIADYGGWISFADYMEAVLYTPGLGYYSGGMTKFGTQGDFVTAPEISPLFGRTLAQYAAHILVQIEQGAILEFGAGSGQLAVDLLSELERQNSLPANYFILDLSANLQQRQRTLIEQKIPHLASRVQWLTELPDPFSGLILANEVLDAMPVHLAVWQNGNIAERGVAWNDAQDNHLTWQDRPLTISALFDVARQLPPANFTADTMETYVSEINLASQHFIRTLADILEKGLILLIDYGFGESEYYHPQRKEGTLMCHYRHHAHDNPFYLPGLQDITSHVDFSTIAHTAKNEGLALAGYTTQANFLINCGITDLLAQTPAENTSTYLPQANQVQRLISPAEMGELFKVIALSKNIDDDTTTLGFTRGDFRRLL